MKKTEKLRKLVEMLHVKLDYMIHSTGRTIATKGALGDNRQIFISGEQQFMAWVAQMKKGKEGTQKEIPIEKNESIITKPNKKDEGIKN